jgi:CO/xanthine dehydrogenase Mo-binding subunit/aerobic-type carbon monoxide dehydrogenase small subunit (CoxS/CutS family)
MMVDKTVVFKVNGEQVRLPLPPHKTLLSFLREDLHLTGAKQACDHEGICGACTVIVDGVARPSCQIQLDDMAGREVQTIEGLSVQGDLHPLQKAFVLHHVMQCGYATPGQIVAAKALLDRNPSPTRGEAAEALRYHVSRCSAGYKAPDAILDAAAAMRGEKTLEWNDVIAKNERHAISKVTGSLKYTDDLFFPGMLFGRVKRSELPHALIEKVDIEEAGRMPGVVAILTSKDVPGSNLYGLLQADQPIYCEDQVLMVGDALALVVAESFEQADATLEKVRVTYSPLPVVTDPRDSLKPGAFQLHQSTEENRDNGNINRHVKLRKGDVAEGFKKADLIVEGDYYAPFQEHAYEELECSIGAPEGDGVVVYCGSQGPVFDRAQIASALGIAEDLVRVAHMPVGGGFGGKEDVSAQIHAGLAAYVLQRPVKVRFSRSESLSTHHKRHAEFMHYKTGVTRDGRVVALEARIVGDTGAYASTGEAVLFRSASFAGGPYEIPNVKVDSYAVYTNNITCGAFRGFGSPQPCLAAEVQMEKLAHQLGVDPIEFRLRNALAIGSSTITGSVISEEVGDGIRECIQAVKIALDNAPLPVPGPDEKLGIGFSASYKNVGLGGGIPDNVGAKISLQEDGTFLLRVGATDLGQGSTETFLNIASEILGISRSNIYLHMGDTRDDPQAGMTTASRITFVGGNAVVNASKMLLELICEHVSQQCHVPRDLIALQERNVILKETGEVLVTLAELYEDKRLDFTAENVYEAPQTRQMPEWATPPPSNAELAQKGLHFAYSFGAQAVILTVNETTGAVKVHRVIAAFDCGTALNRSGVEGQIEGGVIQGLGYALTERFSMKEGRPAVTSFAELGLMQTPDLPVIESILIEKPHPLGPLGAKGMGELPLTATGPAVVNAVHDAVGIWINELPVTSEKILAGLHAKKFGD